MSFYNGEGSLLDDMNTFFDDAAQNQDSRVMVIRPTTALNSQATRVAFYQKLRDLGVNLEELQNILECKDNLLVLSGAGSGKTTALILKILYELTCGEMMSVRTVTSVYGTTQVLVPSPILVCTFLRTGAEELEAAFFEWCKRLNIVGLDPSNIKFRTIHAEVKDALQAMGVQVKVLEDTTKLIRAVMSHFNIRSVTAISRNLTAEEVSDFASLMAYARNRLDAKRYEHPLMQEFKMDSILLDACLQQFKLLRQQTGQMDFEDMQEILLEACQINPNVADFIARRYEYIFIDEFQDTSDLQYQLLKYYFRDSKRVMVIGDSDQCIYSWRGSDNNIISYQFEQDMNPTILELTTNYRCRSNILNFVKPSIILNGSKHSQHLKSAKDGGVVKIVNDGDVNVLLASVMQDLKNDLRVGVLARTNQDLLIPALILELNGSIDYSLSKSVTMSNRLCRQVFGMMDLVLKRVTGEFEDFFKLLLPRSYWYEAEKLYNVLVANKTMNIYSIPFEHLRHSVPTLAPFLRGLRDAKERMGNVEAYLYILTYLEKKVFVTDSQYSRKARDLVYFVKKIIMDHPKVKELSLEQIDDLFNNVLPERLSRRVKYGRDAFVKLTTVHEAKGKEWDSVYIWGNVRGSFPNIVGQRDLTDEELEEERRVHYIACTRAKDKLTIFTETGSWGDFLNECDMSFVSKGAEEVPSLPNITFVKSQQVFRSAESSAFPAEPDYESLLREYIHQVEDEGGIMNERYTNMELVLNRYTFEDLVEELKKRYGAHLAYNSRDSQFLDDFFSTLADELFNMGNL